MPTAIPMQQISRPRSSFGQPICASLCVTMGVGLIPKNFSGGAMVTGGSRECASVPKVSVPGFGFLAGLGWGPRSNCACLAGLRSNKRRAVPVAKRAGSRELKCSLNRAHNATLFNAWEGTTPTRWRHEATRARMSRFSNTTARCSLPMLSTAASTMARAKSSARITWLGNSTRNAG